MGAQQFRGKTVENPALPASPSVPRSSRSSIFSFRSRASQASTGPEPKRYEYSPDDWRDAIAQVLRTHATPAEESPSQTIDEPTQSDAASRERAVSSTPSATPSEQEIVYQPKDAAPLFSVLFQCAMLYSQHFNEKTGGRRDTLASTFSSVTEDTEVGEPGAEQRLSRASEDTVAIFTEISRAMYKIYEHNPSTVEYFIPQICNFLLSFPEPELSKPLEHFVMDTCALSVHFALPIFMHLNGARDSGLSAEAYNQCARLVLSVHNGIVTRRRPGAISASQLDSVLSQTYLEMNEEERKSLKALQTEGGKANVISEILKGEEQIERRRASVRLGEISISSPKSPKKKELLSEDGAEPIPVTRGMSFADDEKLATELLKYLERERKRRNDFFVSEQNFVDELTQISDTLAEVTPRKDRDDALKKEIRRVNTMLRDKFTGVYIPLAGSSEPYQAVVNLHENDNIVFSTKERAPYLLHVEIIENPDFIFSSPQLHRAIDGILDRIEQVAKQASHTDTSEELVSPGGSKKKLFRGLSRRASLTGSRKLKRTPSMDGINITADTAEKEETKVEGSDSGEPSGKDSKNGEKIVLESHRSELFEIASSNKRESWEVRKEKIRQSSAFGHVEGWDCVSVIVKARDDLRQEHFAMSLIYFFQQVFEQHHIDVRLRPYRIIATSASAGMIETVQDAVSLHGLKKNTPNFTTLNAHFEKTFGGKEHPDYVAAQQNFIRSMAAYSIVCYILQIKDRHNGNILIDKDGYVVHIDFGFILSNSPGNANFESAPFKLTKEMIEAMGGKDSPTYQQFRALCVQAFLKAREEHEKLELMIEMMLNCPFPCMVGRDKIIENLRERFMLNLTKKEVVSKVIDLISNASDHWRTKQYDYFQKVTNGILM